MKRKSSKRVKMRTVSVRDLVHDYPTILKKLATSGEPTILTRYNVPIALLTALDEERLAAVQDAILVNSAKYIASAETADADLKAGRTVSGDAFLAAMLSEEPPDVSSDATPVDALTGSGLIDAIRGIVRSEVHEAIGPLHSGSLAWHAYVGRGNDSPEVFIRDDDLVARFELPGIDPSKDVTVQYAPGRVIVKGESTELGGHLNYRQVFVPTKIKGTAVEAAYHDPILEVVVHGAATLSTEEESHAKAIHVKTLGNPIGL